jgi:hypothetical protein
MNIWFFFFDHYIAFDLGVTNKPYVSCVSSEPYYRVPKHKLLIVAQVGSARNSAAIESRISEGEISVWESRKLCGKKYQDN